MIAALRHRVAARHVAAFVAAGVALAAAPFFLPIYPLALFTLALVYGLFAFGLDIAWGRAGVVSIGHGAFFGLGAYGVAIAGARDVSMLAGAGAGIVAATLIGWLVGRAGLGRRGLPATMAVLTLALTLAASQVATSWTSVTNGTNGIVVRTGVGVVGTYFRTAAIVLVTVALVWFFVHRGTLGRRFLAVRINQQRAEHLGIDPRRAKTIALMISAAVSALAGAAAAPVIGIVSPPAAGILQSTEVLVWLAIGGLGTVIGPFLGAALVTIGEQTLGGVIGTWYLLLMGVLFVLVVRFAPGGLTGLARALLRRPAHTYADGGAVLHSLRTPTDLPTLADGPALKARNIDKRFEAFPVLSDVGLEAASGEVVCLIGPNGAGKTTFLGVLTGEHQPDAGTVHLGEFDVTDWTPHARAGLGLGRLFQIPSVFLELTPAQNLAIARSEAVAATPPTSLEQRFSERDDVLVQDLPLADRRALELAMALAWGPRILLLDEPAAGLSHDDSVALARTLRDVAATTGCTLVAVEHDMEIVRDLADRVVVLAGGRILVEGSMDEISAHEDVRRAYLGAGDA